MEPLQSNAQIIANSSVLCSDTNIPNGLSVDGMVLYLQTRLGAIDGQINELFEKQKKIEGIRKALSDIKKAASGLGAEGGTLTPEQTAAIEAAMKQLKELDPEMAKNLFSELKDAGCYTVNEGKGKRRNWATDYTPEMASILDEAVGNRMRALESGAEIDMLKLQSFMSTRTQVISTASNCMATSAKGPDTICGNLRS